MIFSSSPKESNTKLWALIDIQSGLVRGSMILFTPTPQVVYKTKHILKHRGAVSSEYVTKMAVKGVTEAAYMLAREGFARAREAGFSGTLEGIQYVVSSPWVLSQTETVRFDYPEPTAISGKLIDDIVETAQQQLQKKIGDPHSVTIEKKIFEIKLNGYPVTETKGKTAKHLQVSCALSVSSQSVLDRFRAAAAHSLHPKHEQFHSSLILEYIGLREILHEYREYMSVHIHSELTDLIVVKNGICHFIASFPSGVSTIIRKCAKNLHETEDGADSTLTLLDGGKLTPEDEARVRPVIDAIGKGWIHDLMTTLGHAGERSVIPKNIVLSSHSHYALFDRLIKNIPEYGFNVTALDSNMTEIYSRALISLLY